MINLITKASSIRPMISIGTTVAGMSVLASMLLLELSFVSFDLFLRVRVVALSLLLFVDSSAAIDVVVVDIVLVSFLILLVTSSLLSLYVAGIIELVLLSFVEFSVVAFVVVDGGFMIWAAML